MTMKKVVGYSVYINESYYCCCDDLEEAHKMVIRYSGFNKVEVLPMFRIFNQTNNTRRQDV